MADRKFHLGINMAGAISAGAYTAGVLDFLMQALEEWQAAKDAFRAWLQNPASGPMPAPVPLHDVSIDVFSGASAGGMCASIATVMVQQPFQHIFTGDEQNTTNTFYESWVNRIDIHPLLGTDDLNPGSPLLSVLDSTIIDQIAEFALTPATHQARPYIASDLTLFVTLTNVTGVPYLLYDDPAPTVDEFTAYYADRLRFETTAGAAPTGAGANPLPANQPSASGWSLLKTAAKATGAVPVALASRIIERNVSDYTTPGWAPLCGSSTPVSPDFPNTISTTWRTLNVDGGVTDNSPFQLSHDYIAARNPQAVSCGNPPTPQAANAAVVSVAPFPMVNTLDPGYKPEDHQGIWSILASFLGVTLSQSRFFGEDLSALMGGASFSRFVIAPSDPAQTMDNALQCATLGAFGGFCSRGFRKHDFLLGRRNCQQFLRAHFLLLDSNPVIANGLAAAGSSAGLISAKFLRGAPSKDPKLPQTQNWIPVIPLCGSATDEAPQPARTAMAASDVKEIAGLIMKRLNAVRGYLATGTLGTWISRVLGILLNTWIIRGKVQDAITEALIEGLQPNVKPS
jgi:hypothetical protein